MALAREPSGSAYLLPPDVKVTNTRLAFFLESGDLDSGSPAYAASALSTVPSFQPHITS